MYAIGCEVKSDTGETLATFSSHWAAVAAMLRVTEPGYKSLNGDSDKDLKIEINLRKLINCKELPL